MFLLVSRKLHLKPNHLSGMLLSLPTFWKISVLKRLFYFSILMEALIIDLPIH